MIVAAGLTPAWQHVLVFDELNMGEVNRAGEVLFHPAGKVLNVGTALHHLGGPSLILSVLGGITGESIQREFARRGSNVRWVDVHRATRVCTTLVERHRSRTTELVENAGTIDPGERNRFLEAYADVTREARIAVLTGSLPAGCPVTVYRDLLSAGHCPVILDARGPELLQALAAQPFVVKPNVEELGRTLGRALRTPEEVRSAMQELRDRGAERVLVSQGAETLWVQGPEGLHRLRPPRVPTVNPIGCGDCFAAALAWGVREDMEFLDAVRFAMGAAAQNATELRIGHVDVETSRRLALEVRDV